MKGAEGMRVSWEREGVLLDFRDARGGHATIALTVDEAQRLIFAIADQLRERAVGNVSAAAVEVSNG